MLINCLKFYVFCLYLYCYLLLFRIIYYLKRLNRVQIKYPYERVGLKLKKTPCRIWTVDLIFCMTQLVKKVKIRLLRIYLIETNNSNNSRIQISRNCFQNLTWVCKSHSITQDYLQNVEELKYAMVLVLKQQMKELTELNFLTFQQNFEDNKSRETT